MLDVFVNPEGVRWQRDGSQTVPQQHVTFVFLLIGIRSRVRACRFRMCFRLNVIHVSFGGGCDLCFGLFPVLYVSSPVVLFVCLCACSPFVCWLMIAFVFTLSHFKVLMSSCVPRFD